MNDVIYYSLIVLPNKPPDKKGIIQRKTDELEIIDGYPKFIHEFGVIFKEEYYELMKRF
jgi:hypothetical protein